MAQGGAGLGQRLLDWIERLLWEKQDHDRAAAGWQIVNRGRWQRVYRHPALLTAALAAQSRRSQPPTWERV